MKDLLLMLLAALAACVIPVQAIVNGRLGSVVKNPFLAALISFSSGTFALILVTLIWSGGWPRFPRWEKLPWYLYSGGLLGAVFVTVVLVLVPRIGAANVIAATIVGQLLMAICLDHWAPLGIPQHPLSALRVLGVLLLISGMWLIQRA